MFKQSMFGPISLIKRMTNWRYRYFFKKLRGVRWMILDLEFKRFKTKEIREEIRQAYDNNKARLVSLEMRIKEEKDESSTSPKMPVAEVARLEDEVVVIKRDNSRYEAQLRQMDIDIDGSRATNEFPEGVSGINQQIDSLRELEGMLKDYLKNL